MEFKILKYCLLSAMISSASVIAMESKTNNIAAIAQATSILFNENGIKGNQITNQMEDNTITTQEELNKKFGFLKQIEIPNNTMGNARDEIDFFKNSVLPNISIEKFSYVLTYLIPKPKNNKDKCVDINTFSSITAFTILLFA